MNQQSISGALVKASLMGEKEGWPRCYYWSAVWWRIHSFGSKSDEAIKYSRNQFSLYKDVLARPNHYGWKPPKYTDWQWMQK